MGRDLGMIITVLSLRIIKTPNDKWLNKWNVYTKKFYVVIVNCFVHILISWGNPHNFNLSKIMNWMFSVTPPFLMNAHT